VIPPITSTPIGTPAATLTSTPSPTVAGLGFSMNAARVARQHNPGDLSGLKTVKQGSTVWLMMYYTLSSVRTGAARLTTYAVFEKHHLVFRQGYKTRVKSPEVGRFSRYVVYHVPSNIPVGTYVFRATLWIGKRHQAKEWRFHVAPTRRPAKSG